jgi:hypothetical protein
METTTMNCQDNQKEPAPLPAEKQAETPKVEASAAKECRDGICTINWKPHRR